METTVDGIINWLEVKVKTREPIDAHTWLRCIQSLNVLLSDEQNKLFDLQQEVATQKVVYMETGDTVAKAKLKVEASEVYKKMLMQKAKIDRVNEMIRLGKIHARLADTEYRNQQ